ncbi:hypothetical protein PMAYCL1PPCAC_11571, partial [Pristionchus mayeri]
CDNTPIRHSLMLKLSFQEKYDEEPISTLPDEVWMKIFSYLTSSQRVPLGTTCKRFRELDFELGGTEYTRIAVKWLSRDELGVLAYAKHAEYKMFSADPAKFSTYHMMRLFRKAMVDWLEIKNLRNPCNDELENISTLLRTTTYKKLNLRFEDTHEGLDVYSFITSLLKDRKLENSQIRLSLKSSCAAFDITRMRAVLKQLPKVDKFTMEWTARNESMRNVLPEECLIDDDVLLHVTSHTNHAELENSECSGQGIFSAFEAFCLSDIDSKYISFYVPKPTVEGLFDLLPNSRLKETEGPSEDGSMIFKEIFDTESSSAVNVVENSSYYRVEFIKCD